MIFGFGEPLEKSFYDIKCVAKKIYYGTTCLPIFQNNESLKRLAEFYQKSMIYLPDSARIDKVNYLSLKFSDYIIVKGNEFVSNTYKSFYDGNIKNIDTSSIKTFTIDLSKKDFVTAQKHFLWFGSAGFVHKGLDLILEIFKNNPQWQLHVCADWSIDKDFETLYSDELHKTNSITNHGFIDIRSDKFKELMYLCAFTIFPSCSEGGCAGQAILMRNGGLIPILTKNCGLDVEHFGFIIPHITHKSIDETLKQISHLKKDELIWRSEKSLSYAENTHTLEQFRDKMKLNLIETGLV